jgi:hypothetical protein
VAKTEVLSTFTVSTFSNQIGAVVSRIELHLHVTPDRSVRELGLIARLNVNNSAPRLGLNGSLSGDSFSLYSSHRSVKASLGLGNDLLKFARSVFNSSLLVIVKGKLVHAAVSGYLGDGEYARSIVDDGIFVEVSGLGAHASTDELARARQLFSSFGIVVGGSFVHATNHSEFAASIILSSFAVIVESSNLGAAFNYGLRGQTTSTHVE